MALTEITDPGERAAAAALFKPSGPKLTEITEPGEIAQAKSLFKSQLMTEDGRFRVLDGDTVEDVATGQHLRLNGINTTETGHNTHDEAARELKLQLDRSPGATYKALGTDPYKRTVVEFTDKNGDSINRRMVQGGFAASLNMRGIPGPFSGDATAGNLRTLGVGDTTPEVQAAEARFNTALQSAAPINAGDLVPAKPNRTLTQEFGAGVSRGTDQLQGSLYGAIDALGAATGSTALEDFGRKGYLENEKEAAARPATVQGIENIKSVGDFAQWAAGTLGEVTPSVGVGLATGGVGATAARAASVNSALSAARTQAIESLTKSGIARGLAERAVDRGLKSEIVGKEMAKRLLEASKAGAALGLWGGSALQEGGGSYEEMRDAGIKAPGTAAAVGLAAGALDALPAHRLIDRVFPGAEREVAKRSIIETAKKLGFDQAVFEGSTEGAQELIAIAGRAYVDPNFKVNTVENRMRVINAAAAGALVGTVGGAGSAFLEHRREQPKPIAEPAPPTEPPAPTNAAAPAVQPEPQAAPSKEPVFDHEAPSHGSEPAPPPAAAPIDKNEPLTADHVRQVVTEVLTAHEAAKAIKILEADLAGRVPPPADPAVAPTPTPTPTPAASEPVVDPYEPETGINVVDPKVVLHGADGTTQFSDSGSPGGLKAYKKRDPAHTEHAIEKRLAELKARAESEGTGSTFEIVPHGEGEAIAEHNVHGHQSYVSRIDDREYTQPGYVAHMAQHAKDLARNQKRSNPMFVRRNLLMTEDGKVRPFNARTITRLGLDLNKAENEISGNAADRILAGFTRGLSSLAGMPQAVVPVQTARTVIPKDRKGKTTSITQIPRTTIVHQAGEKDWTIADLERARRLPTEKLVDLERSIAKVTQKAKTETDKTKAADLENKVSSMKRAADGIREQVQREQTAGADGSFVSDDEIINHAEGTATQLGDEGATRELSDETNLDNPASVDSEAARARREELDREYTDLATRHRPQSKRLREVGKNDRSGPSGQITIHDGSTSIPTHEATLVHDLLQAANVGVSVDLIDESSIMSMEPEQRALYEQTLADAKHREGLKPLKGRVFYQGTKATIFISDAVKTAEMRVAVLAHELGHIVTRALYDQLPANHPARARLKAAHEAALKEVNSAANPDFNEWLANQFVAYALRKTAPKNIIETFFAKVAAAVKQLVAKLQKWYGLNSTYEEVLDGILDQAKSSGVRKMWLGQGSAENFTIPASISNSRFMELTRGTAETTMDVVRRLTSRALAPAGAWMRSIGSPASTKLADAFQPEVGGKIDPANYQTDYNGRPITSGLYDDTQRAAGAFHEPMRVIDGAIRAAAKRNGSTAEQVGRSTIDSIYAGTPDAIGRQVLSLFEKMHPYLKRYIPDIGKIKDYFPQVFDVDVLTERATEFIDLLANKWNQQLGGKVPLHVLKKNAAEVHAKLVEDGGFSMEQSPLVSGNPKFGSMRKRTLTSIPQSDLAPFLSKDLGDIVATYIHSATKRAEWDRRFGRYTLLSDGSTVWDSNAAFETQMEQALSEIHDEDTKARFLNNIAALRGQLGANLDPKLRTYMGVLMTYQNFRTLPFAMFSSFTDTAGVLLRSRDAKLAWTGLREGTAEAVKALRGQKSELIEVARLWGVIGEASDMEAMRQATSGQYLGHGVRKWNDALFKWNGLQAWTQLTRVQALATGTHAIQQWTKDATGKDPKKKARAERYLSEIGLTAKDVEAWNTGGNVIWGKDPSSFHNENAEKISSALNTYVNQSILRPNAAGRPTWMSDPKYMLIAHLKQFMFSFHDVILRGVWNEMKARRAEGDSVLAQAMPALILAATLLPMAMAGLFLRQLLQYEIWGQHARTSPDDLWELVQRSGGLGYGQLGVDVFEAEQHGRLGVLAPLGPTVSQLEQILSTKWSNSHERNRVLLGTVPLLGSVPGARNAISTAFEG